MKNYRLIPLLLVVIVSTWIFFTSPPSANAAPPCYNYVCQGTLFSNGVTVDSGSGPVAVTAPNAYTVTVNFGTCQSPSPDSVHRLLGQPAIPGHGLHRSMQLPRRIGHDSDVDSTVPDVHLGILPWYAGRDRDSVWLCPTIGTIGDIIAYSKRRKVL